MQTEELWQNHQAELYAFLLKKVGQKDVAEEILQNAFLKIHQYLPSLQDSKKARAWMFQITRNEMANYFQQSKKYKPAPDWDSNDWNSAVPFQYCVQCFNRFLEGLPENYGKVVELVYFEGKPQQETAHILNISLANVKARLRRAKASLKKQLMQCCAYGQNEEGKLIGLPSCSCDN